MENAMKVEFYLVEPDGEETKVTKTISCDTMDFCNMSGLFEEFKYFLKAMGYDSDMVDGQLKFMDWFRVGWSSEEKELINGETVLISGHGKCEPYVYDGTWPEGASHWCYLPTGYRDYMNL